MQIIKLGILVVANLEGEFATNIPREWNKTCDRFGLEACGAIEVRKLDKQIDHEFIHDSVIPRTFDPADEFYMVTGPVKESSKSASPPVKVLVEEGQ